MQSLAHLLESLESHYGPQKPVWPADPDRFLVWHYSGYPASDTKCAKGWELLKKNVGVEPDRILAADSSARALALRPGGMFPEDRAMRLKEIADRTIEEFDGDLTSALSRPTDFLYADQMDEDLHKARIDAEKRKVTYEAPTGSLADGCFVQIAGASYLVWRSGLPC